MESSISRAGSSYLILLEGILSNPKSIQVAANLSELPQAINAISETRDAVFCRIDGNSEQSIEKLLSQQKSTFNPTSFSNLESKLGHNLATTSSFVKPYRLLNTSRRIPCVVFLLWHTRRYGFSQPAFSRWKQNFLSWCRRAFQGAWSSGTANARLLSTEIAPTLYMDRLTKSLQGNARRIYYSTRWKSTRSQDALSPMASQTVQRLTLRFVDSLWHRKKDHVSPGSY